MTKTREKDKSPDQEWFKRRMDEIGLSVTAAAEAFETYPNMIWRMTSGARTVRPDEICTWARLLNVGVATILQRLGESPPVLTVPLIGRVRANGRITQYPPGHVRRVDAPADAALETVAVDVDAPNSTLQIYDGSTLYYEPADVIVAEAFGRLSVIGTGDNPAQIVGVLDRASRGKSRILIFGGSETVESSHVISATPVRWTRHG